MDIDKNCFPLLKTLVYNEAFTNWLLQASNLTVSETLLKSLLLKRI